MFTDNRTPLIKATCIHLNDWSLPKLSWYGRIVAIKMKILPKFLVLFQNKILTILQKVRDQIQCIIDKFVWNNQKARIKGSLYISM